MKRVLKTTGLIGLALATPLFAIERPTPADAPKEKGERVAAPDAAVEEMPEVDVVNQAWVGLAGSPVSEMLSYHLGLAEGSGVSLDLIVRDSPAEKAGLNRYDVITKLGGVDIKSMNDFRGVIQGHKAGDVIEAEVYVKGKVDKRQITLAERPANFPDIFRGEPNAEPQARNQRDKLRRFMLDPNALPKELFENMADDERQMIERMMQGRFKEIEKELQMKRMRFMGDVDRGAIPEGRAHQQHLRLNLKDLAAGAKVYSTTSMMLMDQDGTKYFLDTNKDGQELRIEGKDGKQLFSGPYNTDVDKEAVPDDLRANVERLGLGKSRGLRLEIERGKINPVPEFKDQNE